LGPAKSFIDTKFNLDKDKRSCFHTMCFRGNNECLTTVLNYDRECLKKHFSSELTAALVYSKLKTLDIVKGQLSSTKYHGQDTIKRFLNFNQRATDLF
jgi:hypothetical protein